MYIDSPFGFCGSSSRPGALFPFACNGRRPDRGEILARAWRALSITARVLLALVFVGVPVFSQVTSRPATSRNFPDRPNGSALRAGCPPGSFEQEQTFKVCIPVTCPTDPANFLALPWSALSAQIPKFDPTLGNLIQVELQSCADVDGTLCWEYLGTTTGCPSYSWQYQALIDSLPDDTVNIPPLGPTFPPFGLLVQETGGGSNLPPGDGVFDCQGPAAGNEQISESGCSPLLVFDEFSTVDINAFVYDAGNPADPGVVTFLQNAFGITTLTLCQPNASNASSAASFFIEVKYTYCTNAPPVCGPDFASTDEGQPVNIDVLANDSDPDGTLDCATLTVGPWGKPEHGTVTRSAGCNNGIDCPNCFFIYTPDPGFCGRDTFWYTVSDDLGTPMPACRVDVEVQAVNECPVAVDDTGTTPENTPVVIDVCDNDWDPDDGGCGAPIDCCTITPSTPDCGGTVTVTAGCQVRFVPPPGFCGDCSFTYTVEDEDGCVSNEATVVVTVTSVNECPIAVDDIASTDENTPVVIDACANDFDPDEAGCGAPIDCCTILPGVPDCGGTVIVTGDCKFEFTPPAGFCGDCTFTYTVKDTDGCESDPAQVTVTVNAVNECPVAVDDIASTPEDTPVVIDVCSNDFDPDVAGCGAPIDCCTISPTLPDCGGTVTVTAGCQVRFVPPPGFCGDCTFTYTVEDTDGCVSNVATVIVTVDPVNECPVAVDDSETTEEDTPVVIDVCANDYDPDLAGCGAPIDCCTITPGPTDCGATVTVTADCKILFTPADDYCGICTFTYTVEDEDGCVSNEATVIVTVTGVNDCPVAVDDSDTTPEDTPVIIDVCANDIDIDTGECGAPIDCCTITPGPADCGATLEITAGCRIRFIPPPGYCGVCTFTYTVEDEDGCVSNEATVIVTVTEVNECPVAVDDSAETAVDTDVVIDVCSNDYDPDLAGCGAPIDCCTIAPNAPDCGGTVIVTGGCQVRFTPPPGYCGICQFTYTVEDEDGCVSNLATVTVQVLQENTPPVAVDDFATTPEDTPVIIPICANDYDTGTPSCGGELDCCTLEIVTPPPGCGTVELHCNGTATFHPTENFCGICIFTYVVYDTAGLVSNVATVTVDVTGVNDCPTAEDDHATMFEGDPPIYIDVCANDSDPDDGTTCGAPLDCGTIVPTQPDCGGAAVFDPIEGEVLFTSPPGYIGLCQFTYTVMDEDGCPAQALVVVDILDRPCLTPNRRRPGSLLVYPEFDNREGIVTIFTLTNTGNREIDVEFVYRGEEDCLEWNRIADLTGKDSFSLITNFHNPEHDRGYAYAFARCHHENGSGDPVAYNFLTGQLMVVNGLDAFSYSVNSLVFQGIGGGAVDPQCASMPLTDLDGDGLRDLDGLEYEMAPDQILIPRFLGQSVQKQIESELILIDFTGGRHFTTTLDFLIYNDNEEEFSSEYVFHCWERVKLMDISNVFEEEFLRLYTNHDPREVLGDPTLESGWFRIDGDVAVSSATSIQDPAFYAILIESVVADRFAADLPFEKCGQDNGALLPNNVHGDQD